MITSPYNSEKSIVFLLVDRAILLSHPQFHETNLEKITNILLDNNYPIKFITKFINIRREKINERGDGARTEGHRRLNSRLYSGVIRVSVPFSNDLAFRIRKILRKFDIHTTFRSTNSLKKCIHPVKDSPEMLDLSDIVCKLSCCQCEIVYIGQTKRQMKFQINEHFTNVNIQLLNVVSKHRVQFKHEFDWENVDILDFEPIEFKRLISEMIHIHLNTNIINIRGDTKKLHNPYKHLLHIFKSRRM